MKPSEAIKPISYLKAHAAEVIKDIVDHQKAMIITQNGVAKVVVQDVHSYERNQESLALLKMLAQSSRSLKEGRFKPAQAAFDHLASRINAQ